MYDFEIGSKIINHKYVPITELLEPNAQIQAHSGGTVKLARAHCDSP